MKKTDITTLLKQERTEVEARIETLRKADPFSDHGYASDNAAVDTDVREQEGHQRITAEIEVLEQRCKDIDMALEQEKNGMYGTCKRCNKEIPPKRLELIPESVYCVACESELTK